MIKETQKIDYSNKIRVCSLGRFNFLVNKFNFGAEDKINAKLFHFKKSMFNYSYLILDIFIQKLTDFVNYSFYNIFLNNINILAKKNGQ